MTTASLKPLFLTHKVRVSTLPFVLYDFHLRDHLVNTENIYWFTCNCKHSHSRVPCPFTSSERCTRCQTVLPLYCNYRSMLYHNVEDFKLFTCECVHIHKPPCGRCLGCKTTETCIIPKEFECNYTTGKKVNDVNDHIIFLIHIDIFSFPYFHIHIQIDAICLQCNRFCVEKPRSEMLREHIYNVNKPSFYLCRKHRHQHKSPSAYLQARVCCIQSKRCCEAAILITDYTYSFNVVTTKYENGILKREKFICYDPQIWRDQSINHFGSWLTAILQNLNISKARFARFDKSNFKIPNLKSYKSGRDSVIRTNVTGFDTKGIYQTAIISCTIPESIIILPQKLYNLAKDDYDLDLVLLKRDPSFHQTCMFTCRVVCNEDPSVDTIIIPDALSKPLNQDQDGDKNGIYLLPKRIVHGFDRRYSILYKLTKMERSVAHKKATTLLGEPRYSFSEYNMLFFYRNAHLFRKNKFFQRTFERGPKFMIAAGCSYLQSEYCEFRDLLIEYNKQPLRQILTIRDVLQKTNTLELIVRSGAKTNEKSLSVLYHNMREASTLMAKKNDMIAQMNRYIDASKLLSDKGHNQFKLLYASDVLVLTLGSLFINKYWVADYKTFSSCFTYMFNEADGELFYEDFINLNDDPDEAED